MPILSSNPINQIKNTHPFIPTRIPHSPNDPWLYGSTFISPSENRMFFDGLLRMDSTTTQSFNTSGYESEIPFGYMNISGEFETSNTMQLMGGNSRIFSGRHNPRFLIKFKFTGVNDYGFLIALANNINLWTSIQTDPFGHSELDPNFLQGIGFYALDGSNCRIITNDGTQNANFTSSVLTYDQGIHTLYLESDYANSRWGYSIDNAAIAYISTKIPDPNTALKLEGKLNNAANDSDEKRFYIYSVEAWQRRYPVS